ncbi:putative transcriptional regulator [Actinacidiphila reveromycinica]|uniref:Putative transcriptional regulator n=1 Tax=Actinacidiphila reveromycinica TaxID=659352 RepID=A0A7U3USM2_9ACTN|nr:helix-turn-helix transcriptional regulator [Streptomyces sp. SN-593]BBA97861.1 putative transcriptional regulator [Streptomyces sp. SN-593]
MDPDFLVGQRIRDHRQQRGRSQAVVAGLCGITEDYLSRIERGVKTPTLHVLIKISRELRVPVAVLVGDTSPAEPPPSSTPPMAKEVTQALLVSSAVTTSAPAPAALRKRVNAAWSIWQRSPRRFTEAAVVLPSLIADTEAALRTSYTEAECGALREAQRCAADLYFLLRSYCRRAGRTDLSLLVADRGRKAAEAADDPIRIAAATWNLGHILLGTDEPEEAADVVLRGLGQLGEPRTVEATAMAGALELVGVVAESRLGLRWEARERLQSKAGQHADRVGDGNIMRTVFGPTNVALHAMSLDMEAGESTEALHLADTVDTDLLPLERQFTFLLEVARCHDLRKEDAAVLVRLLDLETLAPEDLARSPLGIQMVKDLRRRVRPTYRKQVSDLAERVGID